MAKKSEKFIAKKVTQEYDINGFWVRIFKLLKPSHKQMAGLLLLIVGLETSRLIGPYILKLIIDILTNFSTAEIKTLVLLVAAMFAANEMTAIIVFFQDKRIFRLLVDAEVYLFGDAFSKMVSLSLGYHEKENTGSKIIKIQRGINKIDELMANFFWEVSPTIIQLVFTTAILFFIDWRFGLIVSVFAPIFLLLTIQINRRVYPFRKARFNMEEEASGVMTQAIFNINAVKSFAQEEREISFFGKIRNNIRQQVLFEYGGILRQNLKRNFVIDFGRALIIASGVYLIYRGGGLRSERWFLSIRFRKRR